MASYAWLVSQSYKLIHTSVCMHQYAGQSVKNNEKIHTDVNYCNIFC